MRNFQIAGHAIQFFGTEWKLRPEFTFFASKKIDAIPLLTMRPDNTIEDWSVTPVFTSEFENSNCDLSVADNAYFFRLKQLDGPCLLAAIRKEGENFEAAVRATEGVDVQSCHFIYWALFGVAALSKQTVSIHASAVTLQGKTILFLGESGTGKSTHTDLWLRYIPNTKLLNDDSPFIRIETDCSIQVYGSPWSGKTPCYKNMHTPVAAFVRLSQAPHNRIQRLKGIDAIGALYPSCPYFFSIDKRLSDDVYTLLSAVLGKLPVYQLECLPNIDAAQLVYNTLKQDDFL